MVFNAIKNPFLDIYEIHATNSYLCAAAPQVNKGTHKNVFNQVYKMANNFFDNKGCLGIKNALVVR